MKVNAHLSPWMLFFCEQLLDGPKPLEDTLVMAMGHIPPGKVLRSVETAARYQARRKMAPGKHHTSAEYRIYKGSYDMITDCVHQGIRRGRLSVFDYGHTKMIGLTDLGKEKYFGIEKSTT